MVSDPPELPTCRSLRSVPRWETPKPCCAGGRLLSLNRSLPAPFAPQSWSRRLLPAGRSAALLACLLAAAWIQLNVKGGLDTVSNQTLSPTAWTFVSPTTLGEPTARALLVPRNARKQYSKFTEESTWRGRTGRGKKTHFHLLDRYIRRIDALLPEDMEDLVRPLSYKPNLEKTTRTVKITFKDEFVEPDSITEDEVRTFLAPEVPKYVALGWKSAEGDAEVYVQFETNEECQLVRLHDNALLAGHIATVRYTVDNKFRRVMEDLGFWEMSVAGQARKDADLEEADGEDEGGVDFARIAENRQSATEKEAVSAGDADQISSDQQGLGSFSQDEWNSRQDQWRGN
ncbi:unnamed protein product [Polarella glacialis]|uniref:RRM domain-containing protein n=1 Tax=Polarella glacialis TaxID=89957 RepID=A0A813FLW6_POLGL|nr:unnamed protein product [Polarella glacialis]